MVLILIGYKTSFFTQSQDKDKDGLLDKDDPHPNGGNRNVVRIINNKELQINLDWYDYFRNKPREPHGGIYITPFNPELKPIIREILGWDDNTEVYGRMVLNSYYEIERVIEFVTDIEYIKDADLNFDDYPKYPIETLVEENGDCEDTSYLLGSILETLGYKTILILYDDHMAVGVEINDFCGGCAYYKFNGTRYIYVETAANLGIGKLPSGYENKKVIIINYPHPTNSFDENYDKLVEWMEE